MLMVFFWMTYLELDFTELFWHSQVYETIEMQIDLDTFEY